MKGLSSHKRAFAFILCLMLCIGLCACDRNGGEDGPDNGIEIETVTMTVAYSKTDGLNPFRLTSSLNKQLISLLYRGLYYLDNRYTPVADLASDSAVTGTSLEVEIGNYQFSDGSAVGAEDAVYSFNKAKSSELYSELLSGIESCTAKNDSAVIFTLADRNVNALMSLTFPIVKKGTAEKQESNPTGCGCYMFYSGNLVKNMYYDGSSPVHNIRLLNVTDNAITPLVDSGEVDFYYADSATGDTLQISAKSTSVYLNNLVYVGLNGSDGNLMSAKIRRAISLAIDRRAIVQSALQGNARPAVVPFNTSWSVFSDCATAGKINNDADTAAAAELLADYGVGLKTSDSDKSIKTINLSIIYPDSNSYMFAIASLVAEQLKKVSINVTVTPVDSSEYMQTIQSGLYDMYLAEIKISDDMDISSLMSTYGSASYGMRYSGLSCDEYYIDYIQGDVTMDEFLEVFLEEQPFVPICYRNGKFFRSSKIDSVADITENRIFGSMGNWTLAQKQTETQAQTDG